VKKLLVIVAGICSYKDPLPGKQGNYRDLRTKKGRSSSGKKKGRSFSCHREGKPNSNEPAIKKGGDDSFFPGNFEGKKSLSGEDRHI